ncbi:MAG: hypothetical protein AB8I08_23755 [Sandaracinaceae bacterium]
MNKKMIGGVLAGLAVVMMCPLFGLLFVGYDKMMVHNAGAGAEETGTMALVGSGCCCTTIVLFGLAGVVMLLSKPKPDSA